jgi:hypothetical protein
MTERILRLVSSRHSRLDDAAAGDHEDGMNGSDRRPLEQADGWVELRRELDRSRRFGHTFVLMRVPRTLPNRNGGFDLVRTLRGLLRSLDSVWATRKDAFVLLPEADREGAQALVTRLHAEFSALLPDDVRFAAFPADGLTGAALIELLEAPQAKPARQPELPVLDIALHHQLRVPAPARASARHR